MVRIYHLPLDDAATLIGGGYYQLNDDMWDWFQGMGAGGCRINEGPQHNATWYFEKNDTLWQGRCYPIISFRIYDDRLAALFKLTWM